MNDLEEQLRSPRLAPPSSGLDRRMNDAFAGPADPVPLRKRREWWLVLLPLGAAATIVFVSTRSLPGPNSASPTPVLIYEIKPEGLMRDLLLTPPARLRSPPKLTVSVPL